jgi:hypothetical protein
MVVRAANHPGIPDLPIGGFSPNDEAIQIRGIDGLGPVKADTSTTAFAVYRGEFFQGIHTGKRNIVLTLGFNAGVSADSPSALREILYQWFMPENNVELRFVTDERPLVFIYGLVESFEPNIFSQDPEMQISILCPNPDFIAVDGTTIEGVTGSGATTIDYAGSISSGFDLHITSPSGAVEGQVKITNEIGGYSGILTLNDVTLETEAALGVNTQPVGFDPEVVLRHVRMEYTDGTLANLLNKMDPSSDWPLIFPGPNTFNIYSPTDVAWTMFYRLRYGGL